MNKTVRCADTAHVIPSEVEGAGCTTLSLRLGILRFPFAPLRMTALAFVVRHSSFVIQNDRRHGRPARDRYRSSAPVFHRHDFHRPLCGPEGRKPQRLRARRSRNSVVGHFRLANRRGDECRHFFWHAGGRFHLSNYTYLQLALGTILARILVSYIFIKRYYDYKVYSIYEYLTARFGVPTKNAASAIFMFTRVLASGARLYVAAIALVLAYEMIRGVQPGQRETLFIYIGSTIAIVILTAIYTTLGGIKAVIWTDFIRRRS